jgi:predicted metal-binding protein
MERSIPRKVRDVIPEEQIYHDLKRYQEAALEMKGVTGAVIIGRDDIYVDRRASYKCYIPKCWGYGMSASCPPHTLKPDETLQLVQCYRHAIFIKNDLPADVVAGPEVGKAVKTGEIDPEKKSVEIARATIGIVKAVTQLESMAFYDGYHLAIGFGAGTCKVTLCYKFPNCAVLSGEKCRNTYLSRPSMEAVGFDVFRMAARVGWDIYPVGAHCNPDNITQGNIMGIVLVT